MGALMEAPWHPKKSAPEAPTTKEADLNSSKVSLAQSHRALLKGVSFNLSDGKFILELERAREGERVSWVSVPRKTYWPPQGNAASTPNYRQESSTSLSGKYLIPTMENLHIT